MNNHNRNQFQDEPAHEKLFKFHRLFWRFIFKVGAIKKFGWVLFITLSPLGIVELLLIAAPAIIMKLAAGRDQ